jgi:uncharacterized protein involved in outer membrane biogenesis
MKKRIALVVVLLLALGLWLFDWNLLRGPLQDYIAGKSGRDVKIERLSVGLDAQFEPTITLRGLTIANAPWSNNKRPFIVAGEVAFTFSWQSVVERRAVISVLKLVDAQVDLQRRADGQRNWRVTKPEDRGPARVRVRALDATRSTLHLWHEGRDLDLHIVSSPLPAPKPGALPDDPLVAHYTFNGNFRGEPFAGQAESGALLSFQENGVPVAVRGIVTSGKMRAEFDGSVADFFKFSNIDAKLLLTGPSLSALSSWAGLNLPPSPPYRIDTRLKKDPTHYSFVDTQAKVGRSDLAGEFGVDTSGERRVLNLTLKSRELYLEDFGMGETQPAAGPADAAKGEATTPRFSKRVWNLARLRDVDAQASVHADKLVMPSIGALRSISFTAALADGMLELTPLELGVAGGRAKGSLTIDARDDTPIVRTRLAWQDVDIETLLPALHDSAWLAGTLGGETNLSGRGDSLADVLGSASGPFSIATRDARISNRTDAKLGLNLGKMLRTMIREEKQVPVHCASATIDLKNGVGKSRRILVDTDRTHVEGSGSIDLRNERFDLLMTPQPKNSSDITLRQSIRIKGSLRDAEIELRDQAEPVRATGCGP